MKRIFFVTLCLLLSAFALGQSNPVNSWLAVPSGTTYLNCPQGSCTVTGQALNFPGLNQYVVSAPSGSCSNGSPIRVVINLGTLYSCQSGTWGQISGGASMTYPAG